MTSTSDSTFAILYVEDAQSYVDTVQRYLAGHDAYKLHVVHDLIPVRHALVATPPTMLILELGLSVPADIQSSLQFLPEVHEKHPFVRIVVFSTLYFLSRETVQTTLSTGASYIGKEDNWSSREFL